MSTNSTTKQPRHDAGTVGSVGGRWKNRDRRAAAISLSPQRAAQLMQDGDVPAAVLERDAAVDRRADLWWDRALITAEHGTYPKMTRDYAPTGSDRTYRRSYAGAGVELLMPSAHAIRQFAKDTGAATFDVPVSATYPGGTVQGWVRVTPQGPGEWSVSGMKMAEDASAYVSEAVSAVLEARTPSVALANTEDLMARRWRRFAQGGVKLHETNPSTFISGVGYNVQAGTMAIVLKGKPYTYQVPPHIFNMVKNAASPGQVYNLLIRNKTVRGVEVVTCDRCHRFSAKTVGHRCPSFHHSAPDLADSASVIARGRARLLASS
jgi:hypothetical protein